MSEPTENQPAGQAPVTPGAGWHRAGGEDLTRPQRRRRKGGGGWGSGNREAAMVPEAEFTSYYGRAIVKPATWKNPEVPLYLFLGGLGGTSAVIGALGEFTGRPTLAKTAHFTAAGGALASVGLLIVDLGRPMRFLHMLRVFKPRRRRSRWGPTSSRRSARSPWRPRGCTRCRGSRPCGR